MWQPDGEAATAREYAAITSSAMGPAATRERSAVLETQLPPWPCGDAGATTAGARCVTLAARKGASGRVRGTGRARGVGGSTWTGGALAPENMASPVRDIAARPTPRRILRVSVRSSARS